MIINAGICIKSQTNILQNATHVAVVHVSWLNRNMAFQWCSWNHGQPLIFQGETSWDLFSIRNKAQWGGGGSKRQNSLKFWFWDWYKVPKRDESSSNQAEDPPRRRFLFLSSVFGSVTSSVNLVWLPGCHAEADRLALSGHLGCLGWDPLLPFPYRDGGVRCNSTCRFGIRPIGTQQLLC